MIKFLSIILVSLLLLSGCHTSSTQLYTQRLSANQVVVVESEYRGKQAHHETVSLLEQGVTKKRQQKTLKSEVPFIYSNQTHGHVYQFGPGGVMRISIQNGESDILLTVPVSGVYEDEAGKVFVSQEGPSQICEVEEMNRCTFVGGHISGFLVHHLKLYVLIKDGADYKVQIFGENQLEREIPVETLGTFFIYQDQVVLTQQRQFLFLETNQSLSHHLYLVSGDILIFEEQGFTYFVETSGSGEVYIQQVQLSEEKVEVKGVQTIKGSMISKYTTAQKEIGVVVQHQGNRKLWLVDPQTFMMKEIQVDRFTSLVLPIQ